MRSPVLVASLALVASGCFSKPGQFMPGGGDAGTDTNGDGPGTDGALPTSWEMFGMPRPVVFTPSIITETGAPSIPHDHPDLIFFTAVFGPHMQLYSASVSGQSFTDVTQIVPQLDHQHDPTSSADGLILYYRNSGNTVSSLFRVNVGTNTWQAPGPALGLLVGPFDLSADELRLVAGATPDPYAVDSDIVEFTRSSPTSTWSNPVPLGLAKGDGGSTTPSLSADGLEIFYEHVAAGTYEIWTARRTSLADSFGTATKLVIPNILSNFGDPELSPDGKDLYFTWFGGSKYAIYVTHREPTPP